MKTGGKNGKRMRKKLTEMDRKTSKTREKRTGNIDKKRTKQKGAWTK